jgi:hypothetical protein
MARTTDSSPDCPKVVTLWYSPLREGCPKNVPRRSCSDATMPSLRISRSALLARFVTSANTRRSCPFLPSVWQMICTSSRVDTGRSAFASSAAMSSVGVANALTTLVAECEGERRGKVGQVCVRELVGVGHRRTIVEERERTCGPQLFLSQCCLLSRFGRIPRTFRHGGCFRIG